ncbi:MAG: ATP-binding protein [Phycisphaerae bacterium]
MRHGRYTNDKTESVNDQHSGISVRENLLQRVFAPYRLRSSAWRYGLAAVAVALAALLRWSLPVELAGTPYLAFYPAVVVAAAFGGLWPGLLATVGSALCVDMLFDVTPGWIDVTDLVAMGRLVIFIIGGTGVSLIAQSQRTTLIRERRQAEALRKAHDELERRVEERTGELQAATVFLQNEITEREKIAKALRQTSLYTRGLIEASLDPLVTISPQGKITDVNEATERVTGISRGRLVGSDFSDYFTEPQKAREGYQKVIAEGLVRDYPLTIRHPSGRTTDVLYNATVYCNEAGEIQGVFAAARDITNQKRMEGELLQKNKEMEQIIYVTSHDLRSPLVNVQGFGKELGSSLKELSVLLNDHDFSAEQRTKLTFLLEKDIPESLHFINSSVLKMDSLLAGLLKLSRLGRIELKEEQIDMNQLLAEVVRGFEFQFKKSGVTVEISDLPACTGDKLQINQVFSNLLDNALKYFDPRRPGRIRISGYMANGGPVYCIDDNGIGIAPEHHEKVFETFHRLDPTMGKGEGLGLTIVRRILDRHHGTIRIESEPDKGSKFYVSLPKGYYYERGQI